MWIKSFLLSGRLKVDHSHSQRLPTKIVPCILLANCSQRPPAKIGPCKMLANYPTSKPAIQVNLDTPISAHLFVAIYL